jgi:PAS domain-containing protein
VNREECSERIHLIDEYGRLITEFNNLLEALKASSGARNEELWRSAGVAQANSQAAWDVLEKHIANHKCIDLPPRQPDPYPVVDSTSLLEKAAQAATEIILISDDDRQFVEVNEAAVTTFGLPRSEIVGRRIDEFFTSAAGEAIAVAWNDFVAKGVKSGICETGAPGRPRKFEFRAKANFAPGLHLSVLREVE